MHQGQTDKAAHHQQQPVCWYQNVKTDHLLWADKILFVQENSSPTSNRGYYNNYHRPGGQNVGNFITDKSSSRVLAPPGGASQITFG